MRLTVRSIGLLLIALGAWGAIVPFVGPEFGYPFPAGSDRESWDWTASTWQLSLLPGIAAAYGGLILLGLLGTVRFAPALGALIALAAGAWFVLGAEFSRLWTSPPPEGTGSDWMVIATNVGYHEGLGPRDLGARRASRSACSRCSRSARRVVPVTEHPVLDRGARARHTSDEPDRTVASSRRMKRASSKPAARELGDELGGAGVSMESAINGSAALVRPRHGHVRDVDAGLAEQRSHVADHAGPVVVLEEHHERRELDLDLEAERADEPVPALAAERRARDGRLLPVRPQADLDEARVVR